MAAEREVERMVVRLVGDATIYDRMLKESAANTKKVMAAIEVEYKETASVIQDAQGRMRDASGRFISQAKQAQVQASVSIQKAIAEAEASSARLQQISQRFTSIGQNLTRVGQAWSMAITVPLAGLGASGVYEARQFESGFAQVEGLVGITGQALQDLKDDVLSLDASITGASFAEMSKALFPITSAGQRGAGAMDVLTASSRAAFAGLGDASIVADAATSAVNAYGQANLSGTRAVEILTAAVREGKAEAGSFASVFGQILPMARAAGLEMDETAGIIAFLTKTTGNASIAQTQLSGVLAQFSRLQSGKGPGKVLEEMGISVKGLKKQIAEEGLVSAIRTVNEALKATGRELTEIIADKEASLAFLQIAASADEAEQSVNNVKNSVGIIDEAFQAVAKTSSGQMTIALKDFRNELVLVGQTLQPFLTMFLKAGTTLLSMFKSLSPAMKEVAVFAGVAVAALGPILTIAGIAATAIGSLAASIASLGGTTAVLAMIKGGALAVVGALKALGLSALTFMMNPIVLAGAAVVAAFVSIAGQGDTLSEKLSSSWNVLSNMFESITQGVIVPSIEYVKAAWASFVDSFTTLIDPLLTGLGNVGQSIKESFSGVADLFNSILSSASEALAAVMDSSAAINDLKSALKEGQELSVQITKVQDERFNKEVNAIINLDDTALQAEQFKELETQIEKNLEGVRNQISSKKKEIEGLGGISNMQFKKVAVAELEDMQLREKQLTTHAEALKEAQKTMAEVNAKTITSPSSPEEEIDPRILNAQELATKQADALVASLESQTATYGKASSAAQIYALEQMNLNGQLDAQIAKAKELSKELEQKGLEAQTRALTESFQEQASAIGKTSEEMSIMRMETAGASREAIAAAREALANLKQEREKHNLMEEGKRLTEQYASAEEKHQKRKEYLNKLLAENVINQKTHDAAMKEADETLKNAQKTAEDGISVETELTGVDAVEAGSADMFALLREHYDRFSPEIQVKPEDAEKPKEIPGLEIVQQEIKQKINTYFEQEDLIPLEDVTQSVLREVGAIDGLEDTVQLVRRETTDLPDLPELSQSVTTDFSTDGTFSLDPVVMDAVINGLSDTFTPDIEIPEIDSISLTLDEPDIPDIEIDGLLTDLTINVPSVELPTLDSIDLTINEPVIPDLPIPDLSTSLAVDTPEFDPYSIANLGKLPIPEGAFTEIPDALPTIQEQNALMFEPPSIPEGTFTEVPEYDQYSISNIDRNPIPEGAFTEIPEVYLPSIQEQNALMFESPSIQPSVQVEPQINATASSPDVKVESPSQGESIVVLKDMLSALQKMVELEESKSSIEIVTADLIG